MGVSEMWFPLNLNKAMQAAGVLLEFESSSRMDKLRLVKLLYMADRKALCETGNPIIGTRVVAMDNGPLHSEILDLINGEHVREPEWAHFFHLDGYSVVMKIDPGRSLLSRYEIEKLLLVSRDMLPYSTYEVVEITHGFEEWKKNRKSGTSTDISLEDLLDAVGKRDCLDSILEIASARKALDNVLGE